MRALSHAPRRPMVTAFMLVVLSLALVVPLVPQQVARAATFTVTDTGDNGPGTLRQAIIDANATVDVADEITFDLEAGEDTITLTGGQLAITDDLT
ncbi:MAG TPA: hypothetical protein VHG52_01235, partial [Thermomicrobiales bacterium]|nr:hypothetical protein [Thermomicrobiales bacterium]